MRLIKRGPLSPDRERLLDTYIDRARATLAGVRRRFEDGLPEGEMLFIAIRLRTPEGAWEQVLGQVEDWADEGITIAIESVPELAERPREGDVITVSENSVCDWMILKANNVVEGNFVGAFLDSRESS